jgi:hypothetical protein
MFSSSISSALEEKKGFDDTRRANKKKRDS